MNRQHANCSTRPQRCPDATRRLRRGFNLIELLIALSITSALLTATLVSLNASFTAYQTTTEVASTHTIGRLTINRLLTMIRMGKEFGPFPTNPLDTTVFSDLLEFETPEGQIMTVEFLDTQQKLNVTVTDPAAGTTNTYTLLEGVMRQFDDDGNPLSPFVLEYEKGRHLFRATIDLLVKPDDNMSVDMDGQNDNQTIRLVASAMPRLAAYEDQ